MIYINERKEMPVNIPWVINPLGHDEALRANGFLPLRGAPAEMQGKKLIIDSISKITQTKEVEKTHYEVIEGEDGAHLAEVKRAETIDDSYFLLESWHFEDIQEDAVEDVRIFSKLKIVTKLMELGIWDSIWATLSEEQKTLWNNAQNISSAYPAFEEGLIRLQGALPDIDFVALLNQCILE